MIPVGPRFVFSVLYNESRAFLGCFIDNFLEFTGADAALVINLPSGYEVEIEPQTLAGRVFLFNGEIKRHKFGHTLLMGHLESFAFAQERIGSFEFFCTLASNSLLVRRFDPDAALRAMKMGHKAPPDADVGFHIDIDIDDIPVGWWWAQVKNNKRLIDFLKARWQIRHLTQNQIEGLISSRQNWFDLHARRREIVELGNLMGALHFPLEEVLPATFFLHFGDRRYASLCHVFWSRYRTALDSGNPNGGQARVGDFIGVNSTFPDHVCAMKWFNRSPHSVELAAITQPWSRDLLARLADEEAAGSTDDLLLQRAMLEAMAAALREREAFVPITRAWGGQAGTADLVSLSQDVTATRQIMRLIPTGTASAAFIYMENSQRDLRLELTIGPAADGRISIACRAAAQPAGGDHAGPALQGYVYMSALSGPGSCVFRVRLPRSATRAQEAVMLGIVITCDNHYTPTLPWHVADVPGSREFYFRHDRSGQQGEVWLGIPFHLDSEFEAVVEAMPVIAPAR